MRPHPKHHDIDLGTYWLTCYWGVWGIRAEWQDNWALDREWMR